MIFQTASKFEKIVLPHLPSAYNLARWLLRSDADAEDVVQDACLRAYQHFGDYRGGDIKAWLLAIVRNSAYSELRRNRNSSDNISLDTLNSDTDAAGTSPCAESVVIEALSTEQLRDAIAELTAEFREVVVLRDLEGLSYSEIATVTQLPIGTVMSRLSRARRRLRVLITGFVTEEARGRS